MRILLLLALLPRAAVADVVDFEGMPLGSPPAGWTIAKTGRGAAPRWEIVTDESSPSGARVLAQLSEDATAERFALALHPNAPLENGAVTVRFQPVYGNVDRATGNGWRYRDENRYFLVRSNSLESNMRVSEADRRGATLVAAPGE